MGRISNKRRGGLVGWLSSNSKLVYDDAVLQSYLTTHGLDESKIPEHLRISRKERWIIYLNKKGYLKDLEIVQAVLSVMFAIMYIIESYFAIMHDQNILAIDIIDIAMCFCISILFLIDLSLAKKPLRFLFLNPFSYLDYVTVIPLVAMYIVLFIDSGRRGIIGIMSVLRVLRLFRLLQVIKVYQSRNVRNIYRQLFILGLLVISLVLLFAGLFQTVENYFGGRKLPFHDAVYYIWVTMTTIGYGDISPTTAIGKYCVILFFIIGIIVLPYQTARIYDILTAKETVFKLFNFKLRKHMIVTGDARYSEVYEFVKEFFHEQHGKIRVKKLLLVFNNKDLCEKLAQIIDHPYYAERVSIYEGDVMDFQTLRIIKAHKATAAFILTNCCASDPRLQDSNSMLTTLALKNYHPKLEIFAQIILPESKSFLIQAGASSIVCTEDLKLKLMALSVVCPGLSTLVSNLVTSVSVDEPMKKYEDKVWRSHASVQDRWMYEYLDGISKQIYMTKFSPYFKDTLFLDVSLSIYQDLNIIVFAVFCAEKKRVVMNPIDYIVKEEDSAICIAESIFHAQLVNIYKASEIERQSETVDFDLDGDYSEFRHSGPFGRDMSVNTLDDGQHNNIVPPVQDDEKDMKKVEEDDYFHYNETNAFDARRDVDIDKPSIRDKRKSLRIIVTPASGSSTDSSHNSHSHDIINQRHMDRILGYIAPMADVRKLFSKQKGDEKTNQSRETSYSGKASAQKQYLGRALDSFNLLPVARSMNDFVLGDREFNNHIIVTGSLKGAAYIALTLRSSIHQRFSPIVFMSSDDSLLPFLYDRLKFFDNVYFMQGSATEKYDLRRVGAAVASCLLYIAEGVEDGRDSDAECVKCMLSLRWLEKKTRYLCEISQRSNIKFFRPSTAYTGERYSKQKKVMKDVSSESSTDALDKFEQMCMMSEVFSSGRVFPNSVFSRLLCQSFYNPKIVNVIETMCGFSGYLTPEQSSIFQIKCPPDLIEKPFKDAFLYFYRRESVCLGLYRPRNICDSNNRLEYVYCCPEAKTIVTANDKFYVIGNKKRLDQLMSGRMTTSSSTTTTTTNTGRSQARKATPVNYYNSSDHISINNMDTSPTSPSFMKRSATFSSDNKFLSVDDSVLNERKSSKVRLL